MKPVRVTAGAVLLSVVLGGSVWAQMGEDDDLRGLIEPERKQTFRQRLRSALALTDEQEERLRTAREHLDVELEYLRGVVTDGEFSPEEARDHYRQARRIHQAERDTILAVDQKELLARARRYLEVERLAGASKAAELRRPFEYLAAALELSEEQTARWRDLLQRQRAQYQLLYDEGEVPEREDFLRMRDLHRASFEGLLGIEQLVVLDGIRDRWKRAREEGRGIVPADFGLEAEVDELGLEDMEEDWGTIGEEEEYLEGDF